jgi:hypothetical protein
MCNQKYGRMTDKIMMNGSKDMNIRIQMCGKTCCIMVESMGGPFHPDHMGQQTKFDMVMRKPSTKMQGKDMGYGPNSKGMRGMKQSAESTNWIF